MINSYDYNDFDDQKRQWKAWLNDSPFSLKLLWIVYWASDLWPQLSVLVFSITQIVLKTILEKLK